MKKSFLFFGLILCVGCGPNVHESSPEGFTNSNNSIVGGKVVENESFAQHIVAIYNAGRSYWCTGTLISTDTILTAAHCVNNGSARDYAVYFSKNPSMFRGNSRNVAAMKFHSQYKAEAYDDRNDVAVIRFRGSLPSGFTPMDLPRAGDLTEREFYAAGYGTVTARTNGARENRILRYTSQQIAGTTISSAQTQFLVDQTNGHGICFGDSGGPAFTMNTRPVILGIASAVYTRDREEKNKPDFDVCRYNAIYTSVFHYRDWIEKASADIH